MMRIMIGESFILENINQNIENHIGLISSYLISTIGQCFTQHFSENQEFTLAHHSIDDSKNILTESFNALVDKCES